MSNLDEMVAETNTTITMTASKQEVENFPAPTYLYEVGRKIEQQFNVMKQEYILTQSAKLGINPNIVIEQQQFIDKLKHELAKVRAESEKRELAIQDVLGMLKDNGMYNASDYFVSKSDLRQVISARLEVE